MTILGYLGLLDFGGAIRVTSFNYSPEQTPLYYDHTIGLRDNIPTSLFGAKKDTSFAGNPQKNLYRPSRLQQTITMSMPSSDGHELPFLTEAKEGKEFSFDFYPNCANKLAFTKCRVSQWSISMNGGEVPNISVTIMSVGPIADTGGRGTPVSTSLKLIPWDQCRVSATDIAPCDPVSFNLTITNDCKYVWVKPPVLRIGLQSVTGSMAFYGTLPHVVKAMDPVDVDGSTGTSTTGEKTVTFSVNSKSASLNCVYSPIKKESTPGPSIATLAFNGLGSHWN